MKKKIIIIPIIVVITSLFIASSLTYKKVNQWTCAYTGSKKGHTIWFGFYQGAEYKKASPLENWLKEKEHPIKHKWVKTAGTTYGLLGGRGSAHARAPAVYQLAHFPGALEIYVENTSDKEIEKFLDTLKSDDMDAKSKAVFETIDRVMDQLYKKKAKRES